MTTPPTIVVKITTDDGNTNTHRYVLPDDIQERPNFVDTVKQSVDFAFTQSSEGEVYFDHPIVVYRAGRIVRIGLDVEMSSGESEQVQRDTLGFLRQRNIRERTQ